MSGEKMRLKCHMKILRFARRRKECWYIIFQATIACHEHYSKFCFNFGLILKLSFLISSFSEILCRPSSWPYCAKRESLLLDLWAQVTETGKILSGKFFMWKNYILSRIQCLWVLFEPSSVTEKLLNSTLCKTFLIKGVHLPPRIKN